MYWKIAGGHTESFLGEFSARLSLVLVMIEVILSRLIKNNGQNVLV